MPVPLFALPFCACDGLDNDCDGTVDDFATSCGIGECASTGTGTGGVDSCTAGTPSAEICDGLDNDCDGTVDDGVVCVPPTCDELLDDLVVATNAAAFEKDKDRSSSLKKLESAAKNLDKGNHTAAIKQLESYKKKVEQLAEAGKLDPTEAQALADAAQAVIDCIEALP